MSGFLMRVFENFFPISKRKWLLIGGGFFLLIVFSIWFGLSLRKSALPPLAVSGMELTAETSDVLGVDVGSVFLMRSVADISSQAIEERLSVVPSVPFETRSRSAREVEIRFREPLSSGTVYVFKLATDVVASGAAHAAAEDDPSQLLSWAFQTKKTFGIEKTLPTDQSTSVPLSAGIEITFTDEHFKNAEDFFQIEPSVKGKFETHRKTLVFVPEKLLPKTLYTVTMKAGVRVEGSDDVLAEDKIFRFETTFDAQSPDAEGKVIEFSSNWYSGMAVYQFGLGATPAMAVSVSGFETSSLDVSVYRFPDEAAYLAALRAKAGIPLWTRYAKERSPIDEGGLVKVMSFRASLESAGWKQYFLFPETLSEGYYLLDAASDGVKTYGFIQMTDMAAYAAVSDTDTIVWVNKTGLSGSPIAGVSAEVIRGETREALSGTTDKQGLLSCKTPLLLKETDGAEVAFMRVVSADGKSVFIPIESNANYSSGASSRNEGYWSYLYLDRNTYQPTDTLALWGVLRKRDVPAAERLKLKIVVDGRTYPIETSGWGTFIGEIPVKELSIGYYSAQVFLEGDDIEKDAPLATTGFSVETYTKPAYKISVRAEKAAVLRGDTVRFSGRAEFFDGTPAAGVELSHDDKRVVADADGNFFFEKRFSNTKNGQDVRYMSVVPVSGEEGEMDASASVTVFPGVVGVRASDETRDGLREKISLDVFNIDFKKANENKDQDLSGEYLDEESYVGAPVRGARILVRVKEISYVKKEDGETYDFIEKKKIKNYRYDRVETDVPSSDLTAGDDGRAVFEFSLENEKGYEATFSVSDGDGRTFEMTRNFYGHSFLSNDPDYALISGQDSDYEYHLNEKVAITFKKADDSSTPDGSQFLFYRAQRGLRDVSVQDDSSYRFSYAERDVPNIEVRGVMFTGKTYIERLTNIKFDRTDRELSLSVSADKPLYRPGDTVNLDVSVRDSDGNGRAAKVNLSAVDEAQLAIAPHEPNLTDYWSGMYRPVGSGIIAAYASHQYPVLKDMAESGGCFLAGTPVLMADGTEKSIEKIVVGDNVSSRGSESDQALRSGVVSKTWKHTVDGYLIINGTLRVTGEHAVFSNGRWMMASELQIGDSLLRSDNRWEKIHSIERRGERALVYNLTVDVYHTYFAGGVYVHNDKGRSVFLDRVLFSEIETDADGRGKTSFRVPDNLTSWKVASQAVTGDLFVGQSTDLSVPVSLPFFVVPVLNTEYVAMDKPILTLRAFGAGIAKGNPVEFSVESDSLGVKKIASGRAFEAIDVELPPLPEGTHEITIGARSGEWTDKLTRTIRVVPEGSWRTETASFSIAKGTTFRPGAHGRTTIVFGERGMSDVASALWNLSDNGSGRFDGKVASELAKELLAARFGEKFKTPSVDDWTPYIDQNKGFKVLPYGDADLFTTALVGLVGESDRLPASPANILTDTIENPTSSREAVITALLGRAARGEVVLLDVDRLLLETDLSVREKLLLGIAEAAIGNGERGKRVLHELIGEYPKDAAEITVSSGKAGSSEELENTALGALLASLSGAPEADRLFSFVAGHVSRENPLFLERIAYLESKLKQAPSAGNVSFTYTLNGTSETKTMKRGEIFSLSLLPEEVKNLSIESVNGDIGAMIVRMVAAKLGEGNALSGTLDRSYRVAGRVKQELHVGDLVSVSLSLHVDAGVTNAGKCLDVSDTLPAGLKLVTSWHDVDDRINSDFRMYPYEVEGRRVKFCVPTDRKEPIEYFARVFGKGDFSAPGTLVEMDNGARFKLFPETRVTVK